MLHINQELTAHCAALDEMVPTLAHGQRVPPGFHTKAAASFRHLVDELVRCATLADRASGASWDDIGQELGISADAARHRYGHLRLLWPVAPDADRADESSAGPE